MSRMLDEIRQQPAALARTLKTETKTAARLRAAIEKKRPRLVVMVARGTSDNAAQFGRYLIEMATGIPVSLCAPSIHTLYGRKMDYAGAMVVAISQSGESTDTNLVLEAARAGGALTVAVTNEARSTLAGLAEHVFLVRAGPEKSVAATKTYTGQLMVLYLMAGALGASISPSELERLPELAEQALRLESEVASLAVRYCFMDHAVVVGRGLNYSNAFELALKLMETSYVVAERFSAADFMHGPIAMVEANFPSFLFAPSGPTWPSMEAVLMRLRELQAETVVIADKSSRLRKGLATRVIRLPFRVEEYLTPIPYIIPAQLFAAHLAAAKNLNPDQPRTLSKVTRTL